VTFASRVPKRGIGNTTRRLLAVCLLRENREEEPTEKANEKSGFIADLSGETQP
jgi:hypothetical protein